MTHNISFDYAHAKQFIGDSEIEYLLPQVKAAHQWLASGQGPGHEFLGWLNLPQKFDQGEMAMIKEAAEQIRRDSDVLVVVGIGGSYLGARAAIEMLSHSFYNLLAGNQRSGPQIIFAGNQLSPMYMTQLLEYLENRDFSINIISKSGTTTEPAIAFRLLKSLMEQKYGKAGAQKRIYATTDKAKGALKGLADRENYRTFVVPDDVGGRFSVLTAVGLLPIAAAGIDVDQIMAGASTGQRLYNSEDLNSNPCYQYATVRNALYRKGKAIELLVNYEPSLHYFAEWWKQLYGESEGKDQKGIFPAAVDFTTDLHSMGQYIQDGRRHLFATVLAVAQPAMDVTIQEDPDNVDGLNFLAGKTMDYINKQALKGTVLAHTDGGVPNLMINIPQISPFYFGQIVYFFEKACAISGYLLGVNPFDQPGVEAYKVNMFALLGKPGYEQIRQALEARLQPE